MGLSILLVAAMSLASCTTKTTATTSTTTKTTATTKPTTSTTQTTTGATTTTPTTTTATGNWWDSLGTPQYGGELTDVSNTDMVTFDPFAASNTTIEGFWYGRLFTDDWTVDPKAWNYQIQFRPNQYVAGLNASSWEFTGPGNFVVHIRQNIYWQNIAPVNGRKFTAADVVYHYDRLYGLGDGFTKPDPNNIGDPVTATLTSITASDDYTVVFKFTANNPEAILETLQAVGQNNADLEAPEAVKQWGDLNDWHHAIGTGPFILEDFVSGASATMVRNPNYWGYDERYPGNKLPYVDKVTYLIIPDSSTMLSGVRTGKVSLLDNQTLQTAQDMKRSNPEILQIAQPGQPQTIEPRNDVKPFSDINVRKAMQMALNLPEIASTYYGGTVDPSPLTLTSNLMTGWGFPYSQWPDDLKAQYAYNVPEAKALLTAAGYPTGFHTDLIVDNAGDLALMQIVQNEFAAVNITMSISTMDPASWIGYVLLGHKQDALASRAGDGGWLGYTYQPIQEFNPFVTNFFANYTMTSDPAFDADAAKALAATTVEGLQAALTDANKEVAEQHFVISLFVPNVYSFCQPWVKGYNGQSSALDPNPGLTPGLAGFYQARFWIDHSLEK